jgi:hypothetical protein
MTSFEPLFKSQSPNFVEYSPLPEGDASRSIDKARNYFIPQVNLRVKDTFSVLLRDPPSPIGHPSKELDTVLFVRADNGVADVQFKSFKGLDRIYDIAAKRPGETLVRAFRALGGSDLATLRVVIQPSLPEPETKYSGPPVDVHLLASLKDFYLGFREGLELNAKDALKILEEKIRRERPATAIIGGTDEAMNAAFYKGFIEGLKESMNGFIDMFKGVGKFVFDSKFREEIQQRAAELIQPWIEEMITARGDVIRFIAPILVNAKAIGRAVGEEVGKEANQKLATMSATDFAEFSGRILGIAAFEAITAVITELIGIGVVQGLRWIEEGGGLVARLAPRLKGILSVSEELKVFLRQKFGKVVKTAEEAERGSMAGKAASREAANAVKRRFLNGMRCPAPHFTDNEIIKLEEKIVEKMEKVGVPKDYIGGVDYSRGAKKRAFHPGGQERGGCRTGQGIWVEGNVRETWPGFEEWERASEDTKLETIIAHEYLEMKFHSSGARIPSETGTIEYEHAHNLSVQLANATELKISPEARKLLVAMRNKWNLDTVYLPPGVNPWLPPKAP